MNKKNTVERRTVLKATAAVAGTLVVGLAKAQVELTGTTTGTAATGIVQAGDVLVYQAGPMANMPIKAADVKAGTPVPAYAMDPKTKKLRDQAKGNIVLVKPASVTADSKPNAADGVVAYSAICTHQGCVVNQIGSLGAAKGNLQCPCHQSLFNPADNGKVMGGPAPRRLPALPLKSEGGQLVADGDFKGRVGAGK